MINILWNINQKQILAILEKIKEIIFVEDDFDYNGKRTNKKRKIIYTPEELKVIANKRKKIFENPPRNNIEKI